MFLNNDMDFELSKEETIDLLNVLMSPSEELTKRRNAFFSNGDSIEICQGENDEHIVHVEGLDLSFLEDESDSIFEVSNEEMNSVEEFVSVEITFSDNFKLLNSDDFVEVLESYNCVKYKPNISMENNRFMNLIVSKSCMAA